METTHQDTRGTGGEQWAWQAELAAGTPLGVTLPGGAAMELVWCPAGSFAMGSSHCYPERPLHRVTLSHGFWMAKTPVTQAQWKSVMGSDPSQFKGADLPVEQVSWNDAAEFCRRAGLRLPTEAQWEYACRAGSTGDYAGTGILDDMGWYAENSGGRTHPVGRKQPNAWGLFDMHGNVREWCSDWVADWLDEEYAGYYGDSPETDPAGPPSGRARIFRGGSWNDTSFECLADRSNAIFPGCAMITVGFRPIGGFP